MGRDLKVPAASSARRPFPGLSLGALSVVLVTLFHLATIRAGHGWGDDFALYIHHARNLAEGVPYAETGYLYNPHNPAVGPPAYPPGFPVLLAPVVKLFGPALWPMQLLVVLTLAGALFLLLLLFREALPSPYLETFVLLTGFSPVLWEFKDQILSDLPFLFLVLASLACFAATRRPVLFGALAGAGAYAAYATRVLGIVLVPTWLVHDLLRHRRVRLPTAAGCGVFIVLAAAQHLASTGGGGGSYFDQLVVTPASVGRNLLAYAQALSELWTNGYVDLARKGLFLTTTALALLGYVKAVQGGVSWRELFPLLYLGPVILWPSYQGTRFLIPVIPFYLYYCLLGTRHLDALIQGRWGRRHLVLAALVGVAAVTYVGQYSRVRFGSFPTGIARPESVAFFEYVRTATRPEDVFLFSKPRALSLFTGRPASPPFSPADPCQLWDYLREIDASYVVTGPDEPSDDGAYLRRFVDRFRADLELVWQRGDLALYRVANIPSTCATN